MFPNLLAAALSLLNPGFEDASGSSAKNHSWTFRPNDGVVEISKEQAASGSHSMKVIDESDTRFVEAESAPVAIPAGATLEVHGKAYPVSGGGLGIYLRYFDRNRHALGKEVNIGNAPKEPTGQWKPFSVHATPPPEAAFASVLFHSYGPARVSLYLDDIELVTVEASAQPPWPGTYKIRTTEMAKLTAADFPGPDGIVYPDFTYAGVPGGIPAVAVKAKIEDFGGKADDNNDDADAMEKGAEAVAERGGGALLLGPGTYHLARPVTISKSGIVIRGAGADKTKIIFTYTGPDGAAPAFRPAIESQIPPGTPDIGAITFNGSSKERQKWILAQDGKRGDRELVLEDSSGLKAGDCVTLRTPPTERWKKLTQSGCPKGEDRLMQLQIVSVQGKRAQLGQPLRMTFPVEDGSYIYNFYPLKKCGVEGFTLEQPNYLWTGGVVFNTVWESWARGVTVKKAGRTPIYFRRGKWNEIRDCVMDDAWYKGVGGTAYTGWDSDYDCLMENVVTKNLRHAPLVQWTASGNVIRNCSFDGSDAQWHSGWAHENLFENCLISCRPENGGYGYGMYASPPEDFEHGPEGPRNVVYHCDVRSPKSGLWMGGMNENWLILFNRFLVGSGPGIFAKNASFDHVIRGNVICLADAKEPAVLLQTRDCVGIEIYDNVIFGGNGKLVEGLGQPSFNQRNRTMPPASLQAPPAFPTPVVPSIYEWQRAHRAAKPGLR